MAATSTAPSSSDLLGRPGGPLPAASCPSLSDSLPEREFGRSQHAETLELGDAPLLLADRCRPLPCVERGVVPGRRHDRLDALTGLRIERVTQVDQVELGEEPRV